MKNTTTVLFVTHTVKMGGANLSMLQLIIELKEKYSIEPIVLMPHIPSYAKKWNLSHMCDKESIRWMSCRYNWFQGRGKIRTVIKYVANLFYIGPLLLKLHSVNIDIVHTNGSVIDIGSLISSIKHVPHVWHLREYGDLDFDFLPAFGRPFQSFVYRKADVFVAISNSIKEHYAQLIPEEKIRLIYNGVSTERVISYSNHQGDTVNFCMLGRVSEGKNQLEAVMALDVLVNNFGEKNVHLYFIGNEDYHYTLSIKDIIKNCRLDEFVTFTGELKEIDPLVKKMDVGLMLSKNEAFGRVTVEYQMYKLAVIASNTGANPELVSDGKDGYLYELGNVYQLAEKMKKLCNDKNIVRLFGEEGRNKALIEYSSERNTREIADLYKELLKN